MRIITGAKPEAVRQASAHVLFVEGSTPNAVDVRAVAALLANTRIRVEPLGPCFSIRSVAEALFPFHDTYYFLIDRDNCKDSEVGQSWTNFPDPDTKNLLIWRKKEIENYFLDPDYLLRSAHVNTDREGLELAIISEAARVLFRDAANSVIVDLRDRQKSTWVRMFEATSGLETKKSALERLLGLSAFKDRPKDIATQLTEESLRSAFEEKLAEFTGGRMPLELGHGVWSDRVRGKDVLPSVIQRCFRIRALSGKRVQGEEAVRTVVTELAQLDPARIPNDFRELQTLIMRRVQQPPVSH